MALNFSDKQKWVATLEAIITHSPDTFKRKDAVSSPHYRSTTRGAAVPQFRPLTRGLEPQVGRGGRHRVPAATRSSSKLLSVHNVLDERCKSCQATMMVTECDTLLSASTTCSSFACNPFRTWQETCAATL